MQTVPTQPTAFPAPFSTRLREETIAEHRATERSPFVRSLLGGKLPIEDYAAMTAQWAFLYDALEAECASHRDHPSVGPFVVSELLRSPALDADLQALIGTDWRTRVQPLPATAAYVTRLHDLGRTWPVGLLAHHYLRYLGDLSGGQIIARVVRKRYALDGDQGTSFYRFERIADHARFKAAYRARLDGLAVDEAERRRLIGEVDLGYRMTATIFDELDRSTTSI